MNGGVGIPAFLVEIIVLIVSCGFATFASQGFSNLAYLTFPIILWSLLSLLLWIFSKNGRGE